MKIAKIIIKGFQQFKNFYLNLEHPETGAAPDKVCFIGPNGTGKSTLLARLRSILTSCGPTSDGSYKLEGQYFFAIKLHTELGACIVCANRSEVAYYRSEVENSDEWQKFMDDETQLAFPDDFCLDYELPDIPFPPFEPGKDVVIYAPSDEALILSHDLPKTDLNRALELSQQLPISHNVSIPLADQFWNLLIYQIKKRESDYQEFLKHSENRKRTVEEVEILFEKSHPEILPVISVLWNRILEKARLEFDVDNARIPIQLNENLHVLVKLKDSDEQLPYNALSSGIRNYIFKLGHIKTIYFQHSIQRGFLLIDEPENSLYPDLLYDLIDEYLSIVENTQLFVATHSPIIAAQFQPYERIHLEFDEQGYVTPRQGVTPIDDDPNDVLLKDFRVRSLYGKEGIVKFKRFLELQTLMKESQDSSEKQRLIDEYLEIGHAYNFDPDDEIS